MPKKGERARYFPKEIKLQILKEIDDAPWGKKQEILAAYNLSDQNVYEWRKRAKRWEEELQQEAEDELFS